MEDCDIQDKESMLFAGTAISNGSCIGIVNSIGMQTEIGKIQQQIQDAAEEEEDSPLKKKIDNFGERLAQVQLRCLSYEVSFWVSKSELAVSLLEIISFKRFKSCF